MNTTGLAHALNALAVYLDDILICGAWSWFVYRKYIALKTKLPADFTRDIDCIAATRLPVRGSQTIVQRLEDNGFVWVPRGDDTPPVTYMRWPSEDAPEAEVQFLAPKRGSGEMRTLAVQRDLGAETLWHLDILLVDPLEVEIHETSGDKEAPAFQGRIRVPKVGNFIVQKGLIHERRSEEEKIKDLFYVFDLIDSETGLAEHARLDVIDACESGRGREVEKFINTLAEKYDSDAYVNRILEQYAPESRPNARYLRDEAGRWFQDLSSAVGAW